MSDQAFSLITVIADAKKIITNPISFYHEMPQTGGYANPLIFTLVMAFITGVIIATLSLVKLSSFSAGLGAGGAIGIIFFLPIIVLIGTFIGAAILFVVWKLMGSEKKYETAYRCIAYASAIGPVIAIISIIPYIANIIKVLWGCFLMFVASTEVHKLKSNTAKIVFAVLAVIGVLFSVSAEVTQRNFQNHFEEMSKSLPNGAYKGFENLEGMTPEEAGEKLGEFLKGLEKSVNEAEKEAQ